MLIHAVTPSIIIEIQRLSRVPTAHTNSLAITIPSRIIQLRRRDKVSGTLTATPMYIGNLSTSTHPGRSKFPQSGPRHLSCIDIRRWGCTRELRDQSSLYRESDSQCHDEIKYEPVFRTFSSSGRGKGQEPHEPLPSGRYQEWVERLGEETGFVQVLTG